MVLRRYWNFVRLLNINFHNIKNRIHVLNSMDEQYKVQNTPLLYRIVNSKNTMLSSRLNDDISSDFSYHSTSTSSSIFPLESDVNFRAIRWRLYGEMQVKSSEKSDKLFSMGGYDSNSAGRTWIAYFVIWNISGHWTRVRGKVLVLRPDNNLNFSSRRHNVDRQDWDNPFLCHPCTRLQTQNLNRI